MSNAFPLSILTTATIEELKKLVKAEKAPQLDNVNADELTRWRASIPDDDDDHFPIPLDST